MAARRSPRTGRASFRAMSATPPPAPGAERRGRRRAPCGDGRRSRVRRPADAPLRSTSSGRALLHDAAAAGVERFVFASTCSNYGRMAATDGRRRDRALRPSRCTRAEGGDRTGVAAWATRSLCRPACGSRRCTASAPRMRFDLTVNEFTRDLWPDRALEVFGEQFWRPYVHVRDAARRSAWRCRRRREKVAGASSTSATPTRTTASPTSWRSSPPGSGAATSVRPARRGPRDYRVSFRRCSDELGFRPLMTVPDGVDELIAALEAGASGTLDAGHANSPRSMSRRSRSSTSATDDDARGRGDACAPAG